MMGEKEIKGIKMQRMNIYILPKPKSIKLKTTYWKPLKDGRIILPDTIPGARKYIAGFIDSIAGQIDIVYHNTASLQGKGIDEYAVNVSENEIIISALNEKGILNAVHTLTQLLKLNNGKIPCCDIHDWADNKMRGYHLDCKSGLPELDKLYMFIDRLIEWKINTLLIEYEDRFPYKFSSSVTLPGSPSLDEWDKVLKHCRSHGIKIIPLVQTHGHLNYVLKYDEFASLREGVNIDEICPSNPEAVKMVKNMLDEVLELHEADEYFHIGADETWNLATCSVCQQRLADGETKLDIFCAHVKTMHEYLIARGKRIMIWCDMYWRSNTPEMVNRLPKDIILCEWIYNLPVAKGSPRMAWDGKLLFTRKYCENNPANDTPAADYIENAEPKAQEFAQKYLKPDPETGIGRHSAHAEYFMEQGFETIGVGAARSGQCDWLFGQSNIIDRLNNIANWSDYCRNSKLSGLIISSWSRGSGARAPYSPWESALDAIAASAQFLWSPDTTLEEFSRIMSENVFGANVKSELLKIYQNMGINRNYTLNELLKMEKKICRGKEHIKMLKLNCEFDIFRMDEAVGTLLGIEKMLSAPNYKRVFLKGRVSLETYLKKLATLDKKCAEWRKRLDKEFIPYFKQEELLEYVDSRLFNVEFRIKNLENEFKGRLKK